MRFEDRAGIAEVLALYCERVDEYDIDAVAAPRADQPRADRSASRYRRADAGVTSSWSRAIRR